MPDFTRMIEADLASQTFIRTDLPESWLTENLGGIGFNMRYLFENLSPSVDPLGPDNQLVFGAGTFVGTHFPTACRVEASAKSPLTGLIGTSNSGFYFGAAMKRAGLDFLVIKGRAAFPSYMVIDNRQAVIKPAHEIWGKDCWETLDDLRKMYPGYEVAVIGPAGENLVRFASIENGYYDAWGRTGLGAVMGSKNLKAIVVGGDSPIRVASRSRFIKVGAEANQALRSSPFYQPFKKYGTMLATIPYHEFAALPGRNFTKGSLEEWVDKCSRKVVSRYSERGISCQACPIACAHWVEIQEGPWAGLKIKDFEVTPVMAFGAQCGLVDLTACAKATEIGQRYGMDLVSAGSSVAMACEMFERGLIGVDEIGYPLKWGDSEAVLHLLEDIALRRSIGDTLAEGTKRAAESLGCPEAAMHIKGLEIPMMDPRGRWSTWSFGMLTNIRGGDHLRCRNPVENLRFNDRSQGMAFERFGFDDEIYRELDIPEEIKADIIDLVNDRVNIAAMSKWSEDLIGLFNCLGVCIRPPVLHRIGPSILARAFTSLTGQDISPAEIMLAAERSWNMARIFNIAAGEKFIMNRFPARIYQGESGLNAEDVEEIMQFYYKIRGWTPQGVPNPEKLELMGIIPSRLSMISD